MKNEEMEINASVCMKFIGKNYMRTKKYKKEQYDQQIERDEYIGQPRYAR